MDVPVFAALEGRTMFAKRDQRILELNRFGPYSWYDNTVMSHTFMKRARGATGLILNKFSPTPDQLKELREDGLKAIFLTATGHGNIPKGIVSVYNVSGYAAGPVSNYVIGQMISYYRQFRKHEDAVVDPGCSVQLGNGNKVYRSPWMMDGLFSYAVPRFQTATLEGKTLGIIGLGAIGKAVARLAMAHGMRVIAFDKHVPVTMEGVIPAESYQHIWEECEAITLHANFEQGDEGLLAMSNFRQMKRCPLIVNAARGEFQVEKDLAQAKEEGLICGGIIDVWKKGWEPPRTQHARIMIEMLWQAGFVLTPHIAWRTAKSLQTVWDATMWNIYCLLEGIENPNLVPQPIAAEKRHIT